MLVQAPSWLRADGGMLCRCCCCQPVTDPRWSALAVLNPDSDDRSALLREYSVPYVVEMADGYPPIPCPGKVGVATETTGVAND